MFFCFDHHSPRHVSIISRVEILNLQIYFSGLSLNIHRFGDKYRLAIMADTQLGHDHTQLAKSFEKYMDSLGP